MSEMRLGLSPITDEVYVGKINKDGVFYQGEKHNVTNDFIHAVIERWNGYEEIIEEKTKGKQYRIRVEEVK